MNGYVKLYRSILEWEWLDDPVTVQVWVYCLAKANYSIQRWHGEILQPGQFITSLGHMAKELGITRQKLKTAINHLKSTNNLTSTSTNKWTLITIEKWELYQTAGERVTNKLTSNLTNEQPASNQQVITDEERKEREEREELRESIERRSNMPVIPDEATYNVDGETYHYVNGVLQYTPEETRQLLKTAHEQFAPIKRRLMEEAKHHDQM
jgi:hypothetical protein